MGKTRAPELLPPEDSREGLALRRVELYARLLDEAYEIPGLRVRVGWDAILGLVPVLGDTLAAALSFYIVLEAARMGAPRSIVSRMLGNILVDAAVGAIPIVGDLADVAFKSNKRNAQVLADWLKMPARAERRSKAWVSLAILGCFLAVLAMIALGFLFAIWLGQALLGVSFR